MPASEERGGPIRVLRLQGPNRALTAQVFEENFLGALGDVVDVLPLSMPPSWPDFFASLGDDDHFFSPNYELEPLVPWLLSLRNDRGGTVRLLFIAHSPGGMAWIWRLLPPLLRRGDRIVAPSRHAASVIAWMEPRLEPFVHVIPHPIPSVEGGGRGREGRSFLFLGRIRPEKCLHQLLDGYAQFCRRRGGDSPSLVIAGPLEDEESGRPLAYVLALKRRALRLGLEGKVSFPGPLRGREKEASLDGALGLCNLSLSLEESFGKAPAEALVRGLPVLATSWSAFPEMLGDRAIFVRPLWDEGELSLSVDAEAIASGLEDLMALSRRRPLSAKESPFDPAAVGAAYGDLLRRALEEEDLPLSAAPRGALDEVAPLCALSWEELFSLHLEECGRRLRRMAGERAPAYGEAERIQGVLTLALQGDLVEIFRHGRPGAARSRRLTLPLKEGDSPLLRAASEGLGSDVSRLASVLALAEAHHLDEARRLFEALSPEGGLLSRFVSVRLALRGEEGQRALSAWREREGDWALDERSGPWLRLGAEIAREGGPDVARQILPTLREWCRRFPDGPESGAVALGWCLAALACGREAVDEGCEALERARAVLPDDPLLRRLDLELLGMG